MNCLRDSRSSERFSISILFSWKKYKKKGGNKIRERREKKKERKEREKEGGKERKKKRKKERKKERKKGKNVHRRRK